jgi:hypothetical protein
MLSDSGPDNKSFCTEQEETFPKFNLLLSVYEYNFDFFTSLPSEITSSKLQYQDIQQPMLSENHKHIPCIHLPDNQVHGTATDNATQLCKKPLL